jgi:hypothetical protein
LALQKRFSRQLRRKKVGLQSFTSLALFMDDVENLLRDLYGDLEGLEPVVKASSVIVQVLIEHTHQDLWQEFQDAEASDYASGVGVPEGYPGARDQVESERSLIAERAQSSLKIPFEGQ